MELEQRSVIKFFADEGMQAVQILSRLGDHYGTEALLERRSTTGSTR
jgi:hypothetical protein